MLLSYNFLLATVIATESVSWLYPLSVTWQWVIEFLFLYGLLSWNNGAWRKKDFLILKMLTFIRSLRNIATWEFNAAFFGRRRFLVHLYQRPHFNSCFLETRFSWIWDNLKFHHVMDFHKLNYLITCRCSCQSHLVLFSHGLRLCL